jgi:hypothetical protein
VTAICPSAGPSGPKDWVSPLFVVPATALANYIGNAGGVWASLLAATIGVKTIDVATSCGTDPPGFPAAFTLDEILTIQNHDFFSPDYASALAKLNQIADQVMWYVLCECKTGTTPTQPTFPPPPAGSSTVAPIGNTPGSRLCTSVTIPVSTGSRPESSQGAVDVSLALLPSTVGPGTLRTDPAGFQTRMYAAPAQLPTAMRITLDLAAGTNVAVQLWTNAGGVIGTNGALVVAQSPTTITHKDSGIVAISGFTEWSITTNNSSFAPGSPVGTICVETYGNAANSSTACCPPNSVSSDIQDQLLALMKLIQKQLVPVAYTIGTPHTGLSGSGQIGLAGQVKGVTVTVTSSSSAQGIEIGNPSTLFEIGWINWATADFFTSREFITASPMFSSPRDASLFTHIGYSLKPGVVIEITELL